MMEFEEESLTRSTKTGVLLLLLVTTLLAFWGLTAGPGLSDHEAIVAQGARQVLVSGEWLVPEVNGVPFVRKPPLPFWAVAASSILVDPQQVDPPVSPFAARFPSALALVGTTMLVYAMGRAMFGHRIALIAGAAVATSAGGLFFSHNSQVEMVLTFFCTASFATFWFATEGTSRRTLYMLLYYVAFALAMLCKAPLPIAVVALPLFVWWFATTPLLAKAGCGTDGESRGILATVKTQIGRLRDLRLISGTILFLLIFVPWPLYVYRTVENAVPLWRIEYFARFGGELSAKSSPFWYYLPIAFVLVFPYSLSLPEAVIAPLLGAYRKHRRGIAFALTWVVVHFVFVSASSFKRPHYVASALPALALLLGPVLDSLFMTKRSFHRRSLLAAIGIIIVLIPAALLVGIYFIRKEYTAVLWTYAGGAVIAAVGIALAGVAFLKRERATSLVTLWSTVAIGFGWAWYALGQSQALQWQAYELVDCIKQAGVTKDMPIVWVLGRPDSRLPFYLGRDVEPLYNELELAPRRKGRQVISDDLLREGAERLYERISSDKHTYFILDAKHWEMLQQDNPPPTYEVARVQGQNPKDIRDDWVLFTNKPAE